VVIETVGAATFDHSLKCAAPQARIVVSGATSGHLASVNLRRVFAMQLEILGSTMGTREELVELLELFASRGIRPIVDHVYGFSEVREAFARLHSGDVFGKVVVDHTR
jgi:D-arabinose 1-dehydrogenase-like Zn-dependent alcohol dehydrogenase